MKLNERIETIVDSTEIGGLELNVLKTKELYASVIENKLGMDSRLSDSSSDRAESVFRGLEFNKEKMTSQAVVILDGQKPIGILSFVITPKHIFNMQSRYLKRIGDGFIVQDFRHAIGEDLPDFIISPAWARIDDGYRGKFTIRLFRLYESVINEIIESAPPRTGMEAIAQGQHWPGNMKEWSRLILSLPIGDAVPEDRIRFDPEISGKPKISSESTVKLAGHLGLEKIDQVCNYKTLGPIFYKRVR